MIAHVLRQFAEASDGNFVRRGWSTSMRRSAWTRGVPGEVYWPSQHALMNRLLVGSTCVVACDPKDTGSLYGAVVYSPGPKALVHWLYVKGCFRRLGLGERLLYTAVGDKRPIYVTQVTDVLTQDIVQRYAVIPSPYLLTGTHEETDATREHQREHRLNGAA